MTPKQLLPLLALLLLFGCGSDDITQVSKFHPDDPFKNSIVPSQQFEISGQEDAIVEGEEGTIILFPKGCFKNAAGETVNGPIRIEMAEALSMADMLLSNLTTTSNGKPLETGGMIYFNATANGEQLTIDKNIPVRIEIPTAERKPGMMAWKGTRDKDGNMNWVDPQEIENNLITVDLELLDFLPDSFRIQVARGLPWRNHQTPTEGLTDSLYYCLHPGDMMFLHAGQVPTRLNEAYYNQHSQVINGKYTDDSYNLESKNGYQPDSAFAGMQGIDPASIRVIRSGKYQNTLIATREFEARLKLIFKTCQQEILELYLFNLDKNLWEIDSMAAEKAAINSHRDAFIDFSRQRLTKVKDADKNALLLKGYYEKQLAKIKSELKAAQDKYMKEADRNSKAAQKIADDYKNLLWKREKHRMQTYGFNWTETGWVNIDRGTEPKDWFEKQLEVTVTNGKQYDRVYTYAVYTSIKSIYRLNTDDNENFYAGNAEQKSMLMPKYQEGFVIAIGYQGDSTALFIRKFTTGAESEFSITLIPASLKIVNDAIRRFEHYGRENSMRVDLEYMSKFYQIEQQQKQIKKESDFLLKLYYRAFPCYGYESDSTAHK